VLRQVELALGDCYHCGLPTPVGSQYMADLNGESRDFCCPACLTVAQIIVDSGLSSFYSQQTPSGIAVASSIASEEFSLFDDSDFQQQFVSVLAGGLRSCTLLIEGMHCTACVWLLEKYLMALPGMEAAHISFTEQRAELRWQGEQLSLAAIAAAVAALGYRAQAYCMDNLSRSRTAEQRLAMRRLGVAGIGMMQVTMFAIALYAGALQGIAQEYRDFMRWVSLLVATPVVFYSAKGFFIGAWRGLKVAQPGMDLPVATAIGLAYIASCRATLAGTGEVYFDAVTMFTFLLLGARYLEMRARHYSGRISSDLSSLLPSTVTRVLSGANAAYQSVALASVVVGDLLLIKPGHIVAADGHVSAGSSHVSEAALSGEFMPLAKVVGDTLTAGSLNGDGALTLRVEATGPALKLQAIAALLARGQAKKPGLSLLADRYASIFVAGILLLSALTYGYWRWFATAQSGHEAFWIMLSVLVVSCPCALSLATPAALTIAGNRLRDEGLLVTDGQVWEKLPTITDVVFDKTGTLTKGQLSLVGKRLLSNVNEQRCDQIAGALEQYSSHPIASVLAALAATALASDINLQGGCGVEGSVDGKRYRIGRSDYACALYGATAEPAPDSGQWVLLSGDQGPLCWYELQDQLRDDAPALLERLHERGLKTHILSGDSSAQVALLADRLAVDHVVAGASAETKLDYVQTLQNSGAKVLMLGDGINDIPVLAGADISIAMDAASNLAKTQADCISLSSGLLTLDSLLDMATRTRRIIRQNICWAVGYNLVAIPLAAMALIAPYVAALGMSISSLVVVLNALRLQRLGRRWFASNSVEHMQ